MKVSALFIYLSTSLILFTGCENNLYPDDIWDETDVGGSQPLILSVDPTQGALAGIDTITIHGENFSENISKNIVYFDGVSAEILSSSPNSLTIIAPNIISDSIVIKVAVEAAFNFAEFSSPYSLGAAIIDYGPFDMFTDIYSLDLDRGENLIVSMDGSPNAEFWMVDLQQDSSVWSGSLSKASGMKLGPTGSIYYVNYQRYLYKDEQGTPKENSEIFKRLNGNATDLDFDINGNLFTGGSGSQIDVVDIYDENGFNSGVTEVADLDSLDVISLKVFEEYIYVMTKSSTFNFSIYKLPILDVSGSLGTIELVFNLTRYMPQISPLSMTIAQDGSIFTGNSNENEPITLIKNGIASAFYPSIVTAPVNYISFGNQNYVYIVNKTAETNKVQRINVRMNGSEYYGRP